MNSSGIKRGLAATAVAALAVTGLPFLASSASAVAPGAPEIQFVTAGPTLDSVDAAAFGGYVVLKTKGISEAAAEADLVITGADGKLGSQNNLNQTVEANLTPSLVLFVDDAASNTFGGADGYDEIYVPVKVDTAGNNGGGTANYIIGLDSDAVQDGLQADEPRANATQTTSGAPATLSISPASQTAPAGVDSDNYTATVKDSAGRVTQLKGNENFDVTSTVPAGGTATITNNELNATEFIQDGTATFKVQGDKTGLYTITAAGDVDTDGANPPGTDVADGPAGVSGSATLDVVAAATGITEAQTDFVTGADTWTATSTNAFGDAGVSDTQIRPDQKSVTVSIVSPSNANKTLSLTAGKATGGTNDVTFGGKDSVTKTVTLDAAGKGSITFDIDPSSIDAGDDFTIKGGGINETFVYKAPTASAATDAKTYTAKYRGSTTVTVTVADQYGNPAAGTYVTLDLEDGVNDADGETARTPVNADGKATITLTDTRATAAAHDADNIDVRVYTSATFGGPVLTVTDAATLYYTATGEGPEYSVTVDGVTPSGTAYTPNTVFAEPLTDTTMSASAGMGDEGIALVISGAQTGAPVTVAVDNGARVLKGGETRLAQGSATRTGAITGGTDTQFKIVGTKTGLVNVTVTTGGRTKTFQVSVHSDAESAIPDADEIDSARNVTVTAPEKAEAGDVVNFTVKVTDAFGNPVFGVPVNNLVGSVSGPGQLNTPSGATNAAGEVTYSVKILESADSPVTLRVAGTGFQFGAAADHLKANDGSTATGTDLPASENVANATIENVVNIKALEQAVADAQDAVDAAQDDVDAAKGDLAVAKAERTVAQKNVKHAKQALRKAKKRHHGVAAARRELRAARGEMRVANAKVRAEQGKVNRANDRLAAAQAELEAAQQALEDAQK